MIRVGLFSLIVLAGTLAAPVPLSAAAGKVVLAVVVSPQRTETGLSLAEVRNIFLGKKTHWDSGDTILPVLPPKKSESHTDAFFSKALSITPDEFLRLWQNRVFRGTSIAMPEQFPSMKETLRALRKSGSVVVIPAVDVDKFRQYLKVLTIDGKKPTDDGYPLAFEP